MITPNRRLTCLALLLGAQGAAFFSTHAMAHDFRDLGELSGEYRDGRQSVRLRPDGRFTWEATYLPAGTDAGVNVTASGTARLNADGLSVAVDERSLAAAHGGPVPTAAKALLPIQLYPVKVANLAVLLDENAINDVANRVNAFGESQVDVAPYLHRMPPGAKEEGPLYVKPTLLIPKAFAHRLLAAPLNGKVVKIEDIAEKQINVAGWMQPPVWRTQYSARLVIDLGSSSGVFQGMRLYVGSMRQAALVQRVLADQCEAQMVWLDAAPSVGSSATSAFR